MATSGSPLPPTSLFAVRRSASLPGRAPAHRRRHLSLPLRCRAPEGVEAGPSAAVRRREASVALGGLLLSRLLDSRPAAAKEDCTFSVAPSGLAFCDRVVGTGPEATKGQLIKAHYVGKLEDGKVFDSSYNRGKPLAIRIGVGEVIKGWDQGILGGEGIPPMLAGGKRTLRVPPELGYGSRGAGCRGGSCVIPPDSTLIFDVEFVGKA